MFRTLGKAREIRAAGSEQLGASSGDSPVEIPYAIRWLVPRLL